METKEVRRVSIYASSLVYKNRGKEMKELLKPVFRSILSDLVKHFCNTSV